MLLVTAVVTLTTVYYSGHLSDLFGRLRVLAASGFSIAVALLLFALTEEIGVSVLVASALIGFGWGLMYTLAPVVLTRIVTAESRVQMFSLYSVFLMAGFGLSPVFASVLTDWGYEIQDAFKLVAVFCAISGTVFLLLTEPVRVHAVSDAADNRSKLSVVAVTAILKSKAWLPITMVCIGASVFAGVNNFQTVIATAEGLDYADYFFAYTITTILCRIGLARYKGGASPYRIIGVLQSVMCISVLLFLVIDGSRTVYILCAILFAIGYGASYPVLAAMAANDAKQELVPQTIQLFSLTYFIGIFGFPLIAGWLIVDFGIATLLICVALLAAIEATMAFGRHFR